MVVTNTCSNFGGFRSSPPPPHLNIFQPCGNMLVGDVCKNIYRKIIWKEMEKMKLILGKK